MPTAEGDEWFAVTQDETVALGRFESLEHAVACFEAARAALIAGAAAETGVVPPEAPPPNVTDLDEYRRRSR